MSPVASTEWKLSKYGVFSGPNARNCWFSHICWKNPSWTTSFFVLCELSIMTNAISYITLVPLAKTSHKRKTFSLPSSTNRICFSITIDSTLPVGTLISSQTDNQPHSWWTFFDSCFIMINFYDELKFSNSPVYSTPFPHFFGYKKCQKWKSDYHSSS